MAPPLQHSLTKLMLLPRSTLLHAWMGVSATADALRPRSHRNSIAQDMHQHTFLSPCSPDALIIPALPSVLPATSTC
jgi:hypothetical protein